jgi:release factor glutamine methyltransferase
MTIDDAYKALLDPLKNIYESREATNIADWVFESITGINRLKRLTNKTSEMDSSKSKLLDESLQRLLSYEPLQYVLNEAWFFKMKLFVNKEVLIPRPETEEFVEWILDDIRKHVRYQGADIHIVDIGTGSGCIAIALKKEIPGSTIYSIDISEPALRVARQNAEAHMVKIDFLQLNFLDESNWDKLNSFDIIVSNPPYIPEGEKIKLDKNVVMHEPHLALFVENSNPFIFYKKIIMFASEHLLPGGKVYVEVHEDYSGEVANLFLKENFKTRLKKDLHGRDRMICAFR